MCGFFGAIAKNEIYLKDYFFHNYRGPDAYREKYISDSKLGVVSLAHSRLEITGDNNNGMQPCLEENISMVYNGELFGINLANYGFSDTRYLFESINKFSLTKDINKFIPFINNLNGYFAFAILDTQNHQIFLVRDRYGQKPLFYGVYNSDFCFGSTITDVKNYLGISVNVNKVGTRIGGGFIYDELNPVAQSEIKQVPPGCILRYSQDNVDIIKWHERDNLNIYQGERYDAYLDRLDFLLDEAVKIRCESPEKIAISLSGGYDSTLIASYACKHASDLKAFTLSTLDPNYDESQKASLTAKRLDIPLFITKEKNAPFSEFKRLSKAIEIPSFNQSFTAYNEHYRSISNDGFKVVLEGHGADELFGGYPTNQMELLYVFLKNFNFLKLVNGISIAKNHFGMRSFNIFKSFIRRFIFGFFEEKDQTPENLIHEFFFKYSLPSNLRVYDRMTLINNLEHRSPFLDKSIVDLAQTSPAKILFHNEYPKAPIRDLLLRKNLLIKSKKVGFTSSFNFSSRFSKNQNRNKLLNNYYKVSVELLNQLLNE